MSEKKLTLVYLESSRLDLLIQNPRKLRDPDAIKKLVKLIKEHGFQNPLQVYDEENKRFTILCGNNRFKAGIELGMTEFPCIIYSGDRKVALARAVSDNKSNEWTEWDFPLLKDLLVELDTGNLDMELTGFDAGELEEIFGVVGTGGGSEPVADTKNECPKCGFKW